MQRDVHIDLVVIQTPRHHSHEAAYEYGPHCAMGMVALTHTCPCPVQVCAPSWTSWTGGQMQQPS